MMKKKTAPRKPRRRKPAPEFMAFTQMERKLDGRKFIEFPQMKGKTLAKIEMFTTAGYHNITLDFDEQTSLGLRIDPCFALHATYSDVKRGDQEVVEEWLPVHSVTG